MALMIHTFFCRMHVTYLYSSSVVQSPMIICVMHTVGSLTATMPSIAHNTQAYSYI